MLSVCCEDVPSQATFQLLSKSTSIEPGKSVAELAVARRSCDFRVSAKLPLMMATISAFGQAQTGKLEVFALP